MAVELELDIVLDIDGVLIAAKPSFKTKPLNEYEYESYSPDVVRRLCAIGNIFLLSSWEMEASSLTRDIEELREVRILTMPPRSNKAKTHIGRKTLEIIRFGERNPLVWVDDEITEDVRKKVKSELIIPHLLIAPDSLMGLTPGHLDEIERFASNPQAYQG